MKSERQQKSIFRRLGKAAVIFAVILIVAFISSFFFAGGDLRQLFSENFSLTSPAVDGPNISDIKKSIEGIKESWQRVYRIVDIKSAVNENLNHTDYVKLSDIAPDFRNAIVAIEDNRFYNHCGFDIEGIFRAALVNLQSGALVEGGSTITQQLAKNLFLSPERSWMRKTEEIILAVDLELNYSKEAILEMYLNTIYFGSGAYGARSAADIYFAKLPSGLTLAECALLAAIPNAPSVNSPYVNFSAAKERQRLVLDAMVKYKYLEPSSAQAAKSVPVKLAR